MLLRTGVPTVASARIWLHTIVSMLHRHGYMMGGSYEAILVTRNFFSTCVCCRGGAWEPATCQSAEEVNSSSTCASTVTPSRYGCPLRNRPSVLSATMWLKVIVSELPPCRARVGWPVSARRHRFKACTRIRLPGAAARDRSNTNCLLPRVAAGYLGPELRSCPVWPAGWLV
jgi:hypothetical protein